MASGRTLFNQHLQACASAGSIAARSQAITSAPMPAATRDSCGASVPLSPVISSLMPARCLRCAHAMRFWFSIGPPAFPRVLTASSLTKIIVVVGSGASRPKSAFRCPSNCHSWASVSAFLAYARNGRIRQNPRSAYNFLVGSLLFGRMPGFSPKAPAGAMVHQSSRRKSSSQESGNPQGSEARQSRRLSNFWQVLVSCHSHYWSSSVVFRSSKLGSRRSPYDAGFLDWRAPVPFDPACRNRIALPHTGVIETLHFHEPMPMQSDGLARSAQRPKVRDPAGCAHRG